MGLRAVRGGKGLANDQAGIRGKLLTDGLYALKASAGANVETARQIQQDDQQNGRNEQPIVGNADHNQHRQPIDKELKGVHHGLWQGDVYGEYVAGEAIEDAARGGRGEELHAGTYDALEEEVVHAQRDAQAHGEEAKGAQHIQQQRAHQEHAIQNDQARAYSSALNGRLIVLRLRLLPSGPVEEE